jgi:hypothetical protein
MDRLGRAVVVALALAWAPAAAAAEGALAESGVMR